MKKLQTLSKKIKIGLGTGMGALFGGVFLLAQSLAATGQLYISPSSASVQNGSNVTVQLRLNPGTDVEGVETTLTYDKSKLQVVSIDSGGSAFPLSLSENNNTGAGTVEVARAILPGSVASDSLISSVTFKALTGSGSTNLSLSGNAVSGSGYTDPGGGNATISFTTPASPSPTPPSPNGPRPSPSPSPSSPNPSSPNPKPTPSPSPPSGSGDKPKLEARKERIEFTRAILRLIAQKPMRLYVKYGLDKDQLRVSTQQTDLVTEKDVALSEQLMIPGTTYYYQVVAEDEQGNKTETPVESFKTKGYTVRMQLLDKFEKPLRKKKVALHSDPIEGITDENGNIEFKDVAPGNHTVEYKQGGQVHSKQVTVADAQIDYAADGSQTAEVKDYQAIFENLQVANTNRSPVILPIGIAVAALAGGAAIVFLKRRQQTNAWQGVRAGRDNFPPAGPTPPTTPGVQPPPDSLFNKVSGPKKPDPGSVVAPNKDDNDEAQK